MTPQLVAWLGSEVGRQCLADAAGLEPTLTRYPACVDRLKKHYPVEAARAALDVILLRPKAARKFHKVEQLLFDREGLEMATTERVASYRAERFRGFDQVADLCCGIGGDAITLAQVVRILHLVDLNPTRLAMAQVNLAAFGLSARYHCENVLRFPLDAVQAVFVDPNRRQGERRHLNPANYQPAVPELLEHFRRYKLGLIGLKLAPGVAETDWTSYHTETEFISEAGELKEAVLWFGEGVSSQPRATVLPGPHQLSGEAVVCPIGPIAEWVYDPDAAVVRAKQLGRLAVRLNAVGLDFRSTILTTRDHQSTPFASCYRLTEALPYHPGRVRDWLQAHQTGRVTLLERGSGLDLPKMEKQWKFKGEVHRVIILTKVLNEVTCLVCEPSTT